jgi:glycosyltransferase involved in cell wall biosynthesis
MKTICLLESASRCDGGIFEAECTLQKELNLRQGVEVEVMGLEDRYTAEDRHRWAPLKPITVKASWPHALGYSPELFPLMNQASDLLYAATLWKYPSWAALRWTQETKKPMMSAPHGSLDGWALNHSAWKKRLASVLFKRRQLRRATCLRALCLSEAETFRKLGLTNPIAIIPNGVTIPKGTTLHRKCSKKENEGRKILLFLGRIHPKKGLVNLLKAWSRSKKDRGWQLMLAGWDQVDHQAVLMRLCDELGLRYRGPLHTDGKTVAHEDVIFQGPVFGDEKKNLLESSHAFILPSLSEGLPMSVLEACAYRLPVLITPQCNLSAAIDCGAGLHITTTVEGIVSGLDQLFASSETGREVMGDRGWALVNDQFNWETIAASMKQVYSWMLGGGLPPSSVIVK